MSDFPGKKIQDELPELRKLVRKSQEYFRDNYKRFNDFRKFVYETSITQTESDINDQLQRPNLEFNVLTAYQSRLCGEFSKQEPSIEVTADEGANIDPKIIDIVEGHLRHIIDDAKRSNTQYQTYRDCLSGGFSTMRVFTEYANNKSFKQVIKVRRAKYPTMCGYDPLATEPHKGDGEFSFDLSPKKKEDVESEYGADVSDIKFSPSSTLEGFNWSFNNNNDDIVLVCSLFKKKKKRVKIVETAAGDTMTQKEYDDEMSKWSEIGRIEQPPIITTSRWTMLTTICHYVFIENKVLEYTETDFNELPNVFMDGDSIDLYDDMRGSIKQLTRPYCYNAKGAQQLKNLAGQSLAGYLENISQHKYIVKKEAIPEEKAYQHALTNLQVANTIVVNAYKDNNPNHVIPEPILPVQPQAAPPEITNSLQMADQIIQNELGSYDAALGINENQLSGVAIVEAATQSQAAAMPYVVNYICGWGQIGNIVVDLMPKYYKIPMNLPVIDREGKRSMVPINQEGAVQFNYDSNQLQVKVTPGVNFAIQKSKALQQIILMSKASSIFAQFINTKGLETLIKNMEVHGSDVLMKLAKEFEQEMQEQAKKKEALEQEMMQNNPKILEAKTKAFSAQADAQLKQKDLMIKEQEQTIKAATAEVQHQAAIVKAQAEEIRAASDVRMKELDMHHKHGKETMEFLHTVHESKHARESKKSELKEV